MRRQMVKRIFCGAVSLAVMASAASAADFYLRAEAFLKAMPNPAGGADISIRMWGFARDGSFEGIELVAPDVPGPRLVVPVGDSTLTIHLDNNLPVPISVVIPGQVQSMTPVKADMDGTGRLRVRSFTKETAPGNSTEVLYEWTGLRPGTYLYHSGTHLQIQVQMGLYGAVTHDVAAGEAYSGITYDAETLLLYSEIDPVIHAAVDAGTYVPFGDPLVDMTSTIDYDAKYFLINGEPYRPTGTPGGPTADIAVGSAGETILLRFLNAGQESKAPLLLGMYMDVIAENGNKYPFSKERYVLFLPAGNTRDAILTPSPGEDGTYPIYDRMMNLTNAGASTPGGMLRYLVVAP